jgi:exonuclease SbcC
MKLETIQLKPFAGVRDRTVTFSDGLTVILGPNETGKSATVNALLALLYETAKIGRTARDKTFTQRFFPANGGSFAHAILTFTHGGNACRLEKKWSSTPGFQFAYGAKLFDQENSWDEFIKRQFFPEATARNILVISQMQLSETLHALRQDKDSVVSLGEVLRKTVLATDGISIDSLQHKLDETIKTFYSRWDAAADRPEKGRDIDNPWEMGVGTLLRAYYDKRKAEEELRLATALELRLDEINTQVFAVQQRLSTAGAFINQYADAYTGAREGQLKSEQIRRLNIELDELKTVQKEWPKDEGRLELLQEAVKENEARSAALQAELRQAEEYSSLLDLAATHRRLMDAEAVLKEKRDQAAALRPIPKTALQEFDALQRTVALNAAKLEAQKLNVKVIAREPLTARVGQTGQTSQARALGQNEEITGSFSGSVFVESDALRVEVTSGNVNVNQLLEEMSAAEQKMTALLEAHGVLDRTALETAYENSEHMRQEVQRLESAYHAIADGHDPARLREASELIAKQAQPRERVAISQDIAAAQRKGGETAGDIKAIQARFTEWQRKYQSVDQLNDILGDKKIELKKIENELKAFPALPDAYADSASFIAAYEKKVKEKEGLAAQLQQLRIDLAGLHAQRFDKTVEELTEEVSDLNKQYALVRQRAEAYGLIRQELAELREKFDGNTFEPLRSSVSALFHQLTGGKYTIPQLDDYLPAGISSENGTLGLPLLSAGTADALALAVRLAMAKQLLSGREGFIVMDDPLINLDPARKKASAEAITAFASEGRQVVLFTCDPEHARLFGVTPVCLG